MKKAQTFSVSIVIATYNSSRTLSKCLRAVVLQTYPKNRIELIVADGGSRDDTPSIAKKYHARLIQVDPKKQNAEYNKGTGLAAACGDIVLFLDHDNIMPHRHWLSDLIAPFTKEPGLVGCEPVRFHYDKHMTLLDRYFALIGGSDPIVYYLHKNSHLSWKDEKYTLLGDVRDKGPYYRVMFSPDNIPALGGNGAAIRRSYLATYAKADPDHFIHGDVVADIIRSGHNTYAFIKDDIIHLTNTSVIPFLSRRVQFIRQYQFQDKERRHLIFDPQKDALKLLKVILISLTFVIPFAEAVAGYRKVRDTAWFLHPFLCFSYTVLYGWAVVERSLFHGNVAR